MKPRKANEKKKNKKRERTKIIWLLKLEFKKQKKQKKQHVLKPMCNTWFLCFTNQIFPTKFSPHFGKKPFSWAPPSFSPPLLSTKHPLKSFPFSFSLFFFSLIISKIHFTKHTLKGKSPLAWSNFFHMFLPTLFPYDYYLCIWGSRDLNHKYLPWKNKMPTG